MKTTVRILSLLLVAVLMVGLFAGCQNSNPTTTGKPDGTTAAGKKELKKITVMVRNTTFGFDFDLNDFENTNVYPAYKAICEKYGLDIEWKLIEEDQYETAITTTLAGKVEDMPDIIFYGGGVDAQLIEAAEGGRFLAIQDILEHSDGTAKGIYDNIPLYFGKNNMNGKTYWVGEYVPVTYNGKDTGIGMGAPTGLNVREDFLSQLNMKVPSTIEELEAYLQACQDNDVNHNGQKDEYLTVSLNGISAASLQYFYGVPCQEFAIDLTTNTASTPWQHKNIKTFLNKLKEFIAKNYISVDQIGSTWNDDTYFARNQTAAYGSYYCDNWSLTSCPKYEGQTDFPNLIGIYPDKAAHPDAYLGHDAAPQIDVRVQAFTSKCDIEAAARFLDMVLSEEYNHMLKWGTEGDSFYYDADGKEVFCEGAGEYTTDPQKMNGRLLLCNSFVPHLYTIFDATSDEAMCDTDAELQVYRESFWWPVSYTNQPNAFLANPTSEETIILNEKQLEYQALSEEIFVSILQGEIDINNDAEWQSKVIKPLEDAGMLEILEVYQNRHDRMMSTMTD